MATKRTPAAAPASPASPAAPVTAAPTAQDRTIVGAIAPKAPDEPEPPRMQTHQIAITRPQFDLVNRAIEVIARAQQEQNLILTTLVAGSGFPGEGTELSRVHEMKGQHYLEIRRAAPMQPQRARKK